MGIFVVSRVWRIAASRRAGTALGAAFLAGMVAGAPAPLAAQDSSPASASAPAPDFLDELKRCQLLDDDSERLACFDSKVGAMIAANEAGEVRVIDREDVVQTRRSLFGLNVPEVGVLEKTEKEREREAREGKDELFETTITGVRYRSSTKAQITTAEGAVWEMNNIPSRLRRIEPGAVAVFKPASLGYYFIRIDGQLGVKGRRIR